jgi:hypothetical protein
MGLWRRPFSDSMTPSLFVECGSETFRKPRLFVLVGNVTPWAWSTGTPARLSVVPRPVRVSFAYPSRILAHGAFHQPDPAGVRVHLSSVDFEGVQLDLRITNSTHTEPGFKPTNAKSFQRFGTAPSPHPKARAALRRLSKATMTNRSGVGPPRFTIGHRNSWLSVSLMPSERDS